MKTLRKFGRLSILQNAGGALCISDDWLTSWVTFYPWRGDWAHDGAVRLTNAVRAYLDKKAKQVHA